MTAVPDPDGRRIACILHEGKEPRLHLWTVDTKALGPPLTGSGGVAHVAFPPGGKSVVGAWTYGRIKIWDAVSGELIREVDHDGVGVVERVQALSEELVLLDLARGRACLNTTTGRFLDLTTVPEGRTTWLPSRSWVTATTAAGRVSVVRADVKEVVRLGEVPAPRMPEWDARLVRDAVGGPPVGAVFSPDGALVTVGIAGGRVVRYKADRLIVDRALDTEEPTLIGFGTAPDRLFTHGPKFGVRSWEADDFKKLVDFPKTAVPARLFSVRPDGAAFYYVVGQQLLETDLKSKQEKKGPTSSAGSSVRTQVAYSADSEVMASRWVNGHVSVYREKGKAEKRLDRPDKGPVPVAQALALSADGKFAVLGTNDGRVTVWQTETGKVQFNEVVHKTGDQVFPVTDAVFVPGRGVGRFLTTSTDGRTILWGLPKFVHLREFTGLPGDRKLAVSPDGRTAFIHGPAAIEVLDLP
jgi:WD40 repeat protein